MIYTNPKLEFDENLILNDILPAITCDYFYDHTNIDFDQNFIANSITFATNIYDSV